MKTLIDLDERLMDDLLKTTRAKTKKSAIHIAIEAYLKQQQREALKRMAGNYRFGYSRRDLQKMRRDE